LNKREKIAFAMKCLILPAFPINLFKDFDYISRHPELLEYGSITYGPIRTSLGQIYIPLPDIANLILAIVYIKLERKDWKDPPNENEAAFVGQARFILTIATLIFSWLSVLFHYGGAFYDGVILSYYTTGYILACIAIASAEAAVAATSRLSSELRRRGII